MVKRDFNERIILGLTTRDGKGWKEKLKEIEKFKIKKVALFLEEIPLKERPELYKALLKSNIKEIPLVHIREDNTKEELKLLMEKYKTKYLTIHESDFKILKKWKGFYNNLYLEMNFDDFVSKKVSVQDIGGFCIDISHFKVAQNNFLEDYEYVINRRTTKRYFKCNHINGYNPRENLDMHEIKSLKDFNYLKTMPEFIFGDTIALETYNSIAQQLKFKKYLVKMLNKQFN